VSRTKRQALFQRVGLGDINQQVMVIDRDYLIEEKEKYIDFVRATADADVGSVSTA
jgi:hypothetical protein